MIIQDIKQEAFQYKIPFLLAFMAFATITGPTASHINAYVYDAAMALFAIMCIGSSGIRVHPAYMALLLGAILSLVFNDIPPVFQAWKRLLYFILMSIPISPFISNEKFDLYRIKALYFAMWFSVFIGVASFFCYLLGINYMYNFIAGEYSNNKAGWFGGITVHSMLLGPLSALGATFLTWYVTDYMLSSRRNRILAYIGIFMCIATAMLSASRGSTVAALLGCSIVYILKNGKTGSKITSGLIGLLIIGIVVQPLMKPFTAAVIEKQSNSIKSGSTFKSRSGKWENRLLEFASNPIVGNGFCTVSVDTKDYSKDGVVETGSSWLSVLSMLGLVGTGCIWVLVFNPIILIYKRCNRSDVLFFGIFCVFLLHMATEGYIFAGGNFMFFYFWLFVGAMHAYLNTPDYKFF